jgi:uncharacterized protein YkwD
MNHLPKVIARGLVLAAMAVSCSLVSASPAHAATAPTAAGLAKYESNIVKYINEQRVAHGVRPVMLVSACGDRYAESLASKLQNSSTLTHQSMTTLLNGCKAYRVAENIVRGNVTSYTQVQLWMASPTHRANILDARLTSVGVGSTWSVKYGYTTVADFTRY